MSSPATKQRTQWVDALRGIAVVGMIWTHCANTFLLENIKATAAFGSATYYHGLVAPTFFWLAGLMRGMASTRPGPPKPAWPTFKRLLVILGIGYLMHVPWGSFATGDFNAEARRVFFQSDVLQCLALTSMMLLGLERLGKASTWAALAIMFGFVFMTDPLAKAHTGWAVIDGYLNHETGSLFPLFPWVAFGMAGYVSGRMPIGRRMGIGGALLAFGMTWVPGNHTTLTFFLERLGWVVMIALVVKEAWKLVESHYPQIVRRLEWLVLLGRESLTGYVGHLVIIYALPIAAGRSLAVAVGPVLTLGKVLEMFVCVLLATLGACWLQQRRKRAALEKAC